MNNKNEKHIELDDLVKRVESEEKKKRMKLGWYIIIPVIFVLSLLSLFFFTAKEANVISSKNSELIKEKDFLELVVKNVEKKEEKQQKIEKILHQFFDFRNNHEIDSMMFFFADTLSKYYLQDTISKEEAKIIDERYFKRFPYERTQIKEIKVVSEDGISKAFVNTEYSRNGKRYRDIFQEIHLDSLDKIFYVRGFYTNASLNK